MVRVDNALDIMIIIIIIIIINIIVEGSNDTAYIDAKWLFYRSSSFFR